MSNNQNETVNEGKNSIKFESNTRVVLIGNTQTGKTSLIQRYFKNQFETTQPTICFTNFTRVITEGDHRIIINYCDTAGQERYRALGQLYYRDAIAAILVIDITDRKSFEDIESWITEYRNSSSSPTVVIAANKFDLKEKEKVTEEELEEISKVFNTRYLYTSAFDGTGVTELFTEINNEILDTMRAQWELDNPSLYNNEITLTPKQSKINCNC